MKVYVLESDVLLNEFLANSLLNLNCEVQQFYEPDEEFKTSWKEQLPDLLMLSEDFGKWMEKKHLQLRKTNVVVVKQGYQEKKTTENKRIEELFVPVLTKEIKSLVESIKNN